MSRLFSAKIQGIRESHSEAIFVKGSTRVWLAKDESIPAAMKSIEEEQKTQHFSIEIILQLLSDLQMLSKRK